MHAHQCKICWHHQKNNNANTINRIKNEHCLCIFLYDEWNLFPGNTLTSVVCQLNWFILAYELHTFQTQNDIHISNTDSFQNYFKRCFFYTHGITLLLLRYYNKVFFKTVTFITSHWTCNLIFTLNINWDICQQLQENN